MVRFMHETAILPESVFEKFGGIRPMATALGLAHSTVKAWHYAQSIPDWRHEAIMRAAIAQGIKLSTDELINVRPDSCPLRRGAPTRAASTRSNAPTNREHAA